ncbi:hypothetical protein E5D57_012742 [Metarhizium anisopliae]|nr:hypothetical protein E5D57_012742 [Metarhizium anisopliae]
MAARAELRFVANRARSEIIPRLRWDINDVLVTAYQKHGSIATSVGVYRPFFVDEAANAEAQAGHSRCGKLANIRD